jgi:hypothetical protein
MSPASGSGGGAGKVLQGRTRAELGVAAVGGGDRFGLLDHFEQGLGAIAAAALLLGAFEEALDELDGLGGQAQLVGGFEDEAEVLDLEVDHEAGAKSPASMRGPRLESCQEPAAPLRSAYSATRELFESTPVN